MLIIVLTHPLKKRIAPDEPTIQSDCCQVTIYWSGEQKDDYLLRSTLPSIVVSKEIVTSNMSPKARV